MEEFELDVAYYGISADQISLLKQHLGRDPSRGKQDTAATDTRIWEFGGFNVRYRFDVFQNGEAQVTLIRMQPRQEPTGRIIAKARLALRIAKEIKSFLFDWPFTGKDDVDE